MAGAQVRVVRAGERLLIAERKTDPNGGFRVPGLLGGQYQLKVSKSGYLSSRTLVESDQPATVHLVGLAAIIGRVVDAGGRPVPGARVCTRSENAPPTPCEPGSPVTATADRTGSYRLGGLLPGQYRISAILSASPGSKQGGFTTYDQPVEVSQGQVLSNIDMTLASSSMYAVSGHLDGVNSGQQYVVALAPADQPQAAVALGYAVDGRFRLEGVSPGSYRLFASGPVRGRSIRGALLGPESLYGEARVEVLGQDVSNVTVGLSQGVDVLVRLVDDAIPGESLCPESARVRLRPLEDRAVTMPEQVQASRTGELVRGVAPGRYWLSAEDLGDSCFDSSNVVTIDTESRNVTLVLTSAGAIVGTLTHGGKPVGGLGVILTPTSAAVVRSPESPVVAAQSDADGRFEFSNLAPGLYRIIRAPAGGHRLDGSPSIEIEVIGGAVTEIDLPVRDD